MAALAPAASATPAQRRARARRAAAGALTCAAAAGIGVLAGRSPSEALAAVAVLAFVPIVLLRFTVGVGLFTVSTFIGLSGTAQKGIGAVVVLVALGRLLAQPGATPNFLSCNRRLTALVAAYLAWCVLGLIWATSTGDVLYSLERYAPNFLVFLIVFAAARDRRDVRLLAVFFVLGSAVAVTDAIVHPQSAGGVSRLAGQFGDPNYLAAVLVTGFSLSLALATARTLPGLARLAAAAAAALCMLGILLSVSRGGLVALAVSLLVAVSIAGRWRGRLAFAGAVVVVVGAAYFLAFAPASARQRLTSTAGGGSGRTTIWRVGWREVRANPILGVGAGNFSTAGARYVLRPGLIDHTASGYTAYFLDTPTVAHNTYLEVLAEEGVPGALVFLSIIALSLRCAWLAASKLRERGDEELELISYGVICGTVGFLAASFFLSEEYSKQLYLLLAMGPALLGVARRAPSGARPPAAAQA
ncbi:MAG TPA: O-antigen ligase family protein [Solirubrobacteraceae bacterium]|nr:O-antigen ligase family protein [Solirubrobacteraceae bacterium]